jgi:hypothetical protein
MWEQEHAPLGIESSQPPPGNYTAQVRLLSEGDASAPYGQGVFLRDQRMQDWSSATLVFAGYCKPEIELKWLSAEQLAVQCKVAEGVPKLLPAPKGIVVVVSGGGD